MAEWPLAVGLLELLLLLMLPLRLSLRLLHTVRLKCTSTPLTRRKSESGSARSRSVRSTACTECKLLSGQVACQIHDGVDVSG